jgi:hypothetical protein
MTIPDRQDLDFEAILNDLCASEINASISWVWDGGFHAVLANPKIAEAFITANDPGRRAQPLVSYRVIVELISATTTKTGLTVRCELDTGQYPKGIAVSDAEMAAINIKHAEFHGEWNYIISPNTYPPNCAFIS